MSFELSTDPYWKLRQTRITENDNDEVCQCATLRYVMLRDSLTENPLKCVDCNGEVAPERIGFDERLAEDIAQWRSVFQSLYLLWIDSNEYERWASE